MNLAFRLVFFGPVLLVTIGSNPYAFAQQANREEEDRVADLQHRVAALEKTVVELRRQILSDKLIGNLSGKWLEESWVRSGERIDESESVYGGGGGGAGGEVAWLLATDTSSLRVVLSPEPQFTAYGKFSVDTSKTPAWIDLQLLVERDGESYPIRGIVKYTYMRAEIAIPSKLFDGDRFLDPPRPTTFESTEENGYSVYKLIREGYKRTGVW